MRMFLFLYSSFVVCAADESLLRQLPQHRIRSTKRIVPYGNRHPWQRHLVEKNWKNIEDIDLDERTVSNREHGRMVSDIIDDFLPESDSKIKMWSTLSGGRFDADPNVDSLMNATQTEINYKTHESIRIRASLINHPSSGSAFLEELDRYELLEKIVRPALDTWSRALSIVPVQGNLTIDLNQLYDGESCGPGVHSGLPSVVVPREHVSNGVPDTDLLVYLSIGFDGELLEEMRSDRTRQRHLEKEGLLGGLIEPDPLLDIPACSGTYLASSTYCSTDQFDRPIAGMLHFCIGKDFFNKKNLKKNQVTALHELGHILGFNSQSLAHFRDGETGKPITPRDVHGDVKDGTVECTGTAEGRSQAIIPLPSPDIIRFDKVRNGQRVAMIVTPNVRQIVRNHFDCQSLEGAELESYSSRIHHNLTDFVDQCISDHWERRLFKADIMNPIVDSVFSTTHISPLTLAYFMDSGWYKINATLAAEPDIWGRHSGCSFVNKNCISQGMDDQQKNDGFFCSADGSEGCADDMIGKASCSMVEYERDLPIEYQYFDNPALGGEDSDLDFCPTFVAKQSDLCTTGTSKYSKMEEFGDRSRCISGKSGSRHNSPHNSALCIPIVCAIDEKAPYIRVDEKWTKCEYKGQYIVSWFDGDDYVICPDPIQTCPSFYCPSDCLFDEFSGICNYTSGTCGCPEFGPDTCNITMAKFPLHDTSNDLLYVQNSLFLQSNEKDLMDHTARMFTQMSPGEVLGFVTSSLIAIGACYIIGTYMYKCITRSQTFCLPRFFKKDWHITKIGLIPNDSNVIANRNNKDKVVASVLHNMRVEPTDPTNSQDSEVSSVSVERTFLRSLMPPLPGLGRIINVVDSRYVDDSIIPMGADGNSMAVDGTAHESVTSGLLDLNSDHGIAGD